MNQFSGNPTPHRKLTVSVIVPVYNGGTNFRKCLSSLTDLQKTPEEIIVVADGDTDGSWHLAQQYGTKVIRIPESRGPAYARNLGARKANGDILFFVDSDVTVRWDAIEKIVAGFQGDPELMALFGSYDDSPAETNFLSQYKNLFHHYVHQTANEEASTFWAGCGAIRREVFLAVGGFDSSYRNPSIEDIELGYRLKSNGYRIRLLKDLRVKHLKRWGFVSLLKADIFSRAFPWTRLILEYGRVINDLNLQISNRISVASVGLLILSLLLSLKTPWFFVLSLFLVGLLLALNWKLYRFFLCNRGFLFTAKMIPWHWLYFFYSGMAFLIGFFIYQIKKLPFIGNVIEDVR